MDWNQREMDWYYKAIKANNYPENIINFIEPLLDKNYKMLDIGCGIGTFANLLAERVESVIGVDYSEEMLAYLKKINANKNHNIKVKAGDWNKIDFSSEEPINALITSYSGREVVGNKESILKMENLIEDYIFIFVPGERKKQSFSTAELFQKLGRPSREHECWAQDVFKVLAELDINYESKDFEYNFGQPFVNFEQAVEFFNFHYELEKEEQKELKSFLEAKLEYKDNQLWIDNFKKSTLIWWQPSKNQ